MDCNNSIEFSDWIIDRTHSMMAKIKYDWKITAKKGMIVLAEVIIAGLISYLAENNIYLLLIPILESLRNYIKHR